MWAHRSFMSHSQEYCKLTCFLPFVIMLSFMVSWFGSGNSQLSASTKTLQTTLRLFSPLWQLDRWIGGTADKDHELREDQFTENSSEVRKLTVKAAIVIQNEQERGQQFTCFITTWHPDNTWPCLTVPPGRDPFPHHGKWCEVYGITSGFYSKN